MILTDEQILIRDSARSFAREQLVPYVAEREAKGLIPRDLIRSMGALGLLGMIVPAEWDGAGADHVSYALALMEIAAGHGAVATVMSGHNSVGCMPLLRYGTDEQRDRWLRPMARGEMLSCFCLTEPQSGSDASALRTRARRTDRGWVLDGRKQYITSGAIAGIAIVFAVTTPGAGKRGISAFLVPTATPGYQVVRRERKMGQHASDTCEIALDGVEVPEDALLGKVDQGYRIALANLESGRIGIASQALGMARAALERATAYARERVAFGKHIIEHQAVAFRLADMLTSLTAAEQLVLHAAVLRSAGRPCMQEAAMAKLFATEVAERVCSDAIQTFGGAGYIVESEVERIYRDVRVTKIYEGTNDIQRLVISRALAEA
ncbi:MAG: acyl-CoA dehydrogenase family protein [Rhodospirillales bacterium]|nr:acyl-CoA dehydrogenase family protein [Rhodospirillales bacterium]